MNLRVRIAPAWLLLVPMAVLGSAARGQDARLWKDSTGRFQIQAKFVSVENGKVVLQKDDNSTLEVDLKRLSPADQAYVADQQKAMADNPFQPRKPADNPFQPTAPGGAAPAVTSGEPRTIEPDFSSARTVGVAPANPTWKVDVPAVAAPAAPARPRAITLPAKLNFFEGVKGLAASADGTRAVVGYAMDEPKPLGTTRLVLCDLAAGQMLGAAKTAGKLAPLALSDDGTQVLMRRDEFGFGNNDRLELWRLGPKGVEKLWQCVPYGDVKGGDRDVKWAAFLGPDKFATTSAKGRLVIWDNAAVKPLYHLQIQDGCTPALSPDRKLLAFSTGKEVGLLDTAAGDVVALEALPVQFLPWPNFLFSPTGKRFACLSMNKLYVWDTATGALQRELLLHPLSVNGPSFFTDDNHALVGTHYLVDIDTQVKLWDYQGPETVLPAAGLAWFLIAPLNGQPALVPAKLPQPGVDDALKKATADPNFFILRPGAKVTIDPSGIADASQRPKVVESLTKRLAQIGVQVAPGSPLVLQAATEVGKEEEITYRSIGMGFRTDTFKVRGQISRVKFLYGGQVAWESAANTIPHFEMTSLKADESLADHVKKFEKPNYAFFDQVELPKLLTRPAAAGQFTLGRSQVGVLGVR